MATPHVLPSYLEQDPEVRERFSRLKARKVILQVKDLAFGVNLAQQHPATRCSQPLGECRGNRCFADATFARDENQLELGERGSLDHVDPYGAPKPTRRSADGAPTSM